jgi:hypothetical protein
MSCRDPIISWSCSSYNPHGSGFFVKQLGEEPCLVCVLFDLHMNGPYTLPTTGKLLMVIADRNLPPAL